MKVGIITFHNGSNYGAALQAFALQEAEKKLGNEVSLINYNNRFISQGLDRFAFTILGLYNFAFDILNFFSNGRKIDRFKRFFRVHYKLTELMTADELKKSGITFDVGVSGSDQIWNPLLNKKVDDIYFLNFGNFKKKISYASSLGNYKLNDSESNRLIKQLLFSYDKLSTREKTKQLEAVISRKVEHVCDPTLLLNKEEWAMSLGLRKQNGGYLLIYTLSDMNNVIAIAKRIAKDRGLKIINIGQAFGHYFDIKNILDAGPKEFVELFYNADYIVTNSFHGTAFSVNFHKQFVSVMHPKSPERAVSFLRTIGLESRLVTGISDILPVDMTSADFKAATDVLENMRNESYNYLNV